MFSSRIIDNTSNCNIIKHSLLDDLQPYFVDNNGSMSYTANSSNNASLTKNSALDTLITNETAALDIWQPLIIDNDTYVQNKLLSSHGSCHSSNPLLLSGRLGIEEFYKFTPTFKSWDTTGGVMCVDWLLNGLNTPYSVYYGILCWFKKRNIAANPNIHGGKPESLSFFPNGSRLVKSDNNNTVYVKLSDSKLYSVNKQSRTITNGNFVFDSELNQTIIEASTLGAGALFRIAPTFNEENRVNNTSNQYNIMDPVLWIPDGDCFFYHNSEEEKVASLNQKIPTKSYISSALYQKYSSIYRMLTLDEKRYFSNKNLRVSRHYRRIAHALSASPFVNEFSIEALSSPQIRQIVQDYINVTSKESTISAEISSFKTLLIKISTTLEAGINNVNPQPEFNLDTKFSYETLNTNLISNTSQLFHKLISKYGAYLKLSGSSSRISTKTDVLKFNNKGIVITQVLDNYCTKTLTNNSVFNNQIISFDNTVIETKLNNFNANIEIRNADSKTTIPLYDTGKPLFDISTFCPSLNEKGDVQGIYRADGGYYNESADITDYIYFTPVDSQAQITLPIFPDSPHCSYLNEEGIGLTAVSIEGMEKSQGEASILILENYLEGQIAFYWEQINGPPGTFGKNELLSGTSNTVRFYTNYTGLYTFQCTISSPFGTFKKQRTIYVVDGRQIVRSFDTVIDNTEYYSKFWNQKTNSWTYPPFGPNIPAYILEERKTLLLDKDKVRSNVSKIHKIAISNYHGIVYPIKTDFSTREYVGNIGRARQDEIYSLSKDYIFSYNSNYTYSKTPNLSLIFNTNNTTVKLTSIWLEKIRTDEESCSQCLSLYLPKIRSYKTTSTISTSDSNGNIVDTKTYDFNKTVRTNKRPETFSLSSYEWNNEQNLAQFIEDIIFNFPEISTTKAPKIKSYGGYSRSFIDSIQVNVSGLVKPRISTNDKGIVAANGASDILPNVTGFPLNYRNDSDKSTFKLCYQKAIMVTGTGLVMPFTKGVFHPLSGWIPFGNSEYQIHANRCGLLKFNPGARDSFSFIGPQITRLRSGSIDINNNTINSKVFSSSITLGMAPGVRWDPACSCNAISIEQETQLYNDNQKHKDYVDTKINIANKSSNHGYRILAGGEPKGVETVATTNFPIVNDEFLTDQSQTNFSYSFSVTGPHSLPEQITLPDGKLQFRVPRVNGFGIKDIEVKLNFLNYVNTKNIVVWLDVDYSSAEGNRFNSKATPPPAPLKSTKQFIDQTYDPRIYFGNYNPSHQSIENSTTTSLGTTSLENYLKDLVGTNGPSGLSNSSFKLVLLNQEAIQNNKYNFSVKFSDHASKFNVASDIGISNSQVSKLQNIIRPNNDLAPTLAATGYSDRESCEYSSIIKYNKLNIANNTFSKFLADTLFRNRAPETGPCPDRGPKQREGDFGGITTFTLNIMVLDEEDDMNVLDSTINNQYLSGLESTENKNKSSLLYNSLCNWELILHVGSALDPVPSTNPSLGSYGNNDALSLIDYKKDPSYPGYSFIADLTNQKHLLPIANYNAPYSCVFDSSLCLTSQDDPTGQGVMVRPAVFPGYAIIQIMVGLASYGATTGGTLVGALAGLEGAVNNPAYGAIFDYFKETSFRALLEDQGRQIYFPSYAKYSFGSPEKILINFKKPGSLWYTAEATIFKYHNIPVLKPNRYNFIRLLPGMAQGLSDFALTTVNSIEDIIDEKFIANLSSPCDKDDFSTLNPSGCTIDRTIKEGDIVKVLFTGVPCTNPFKLMIAKESDWKELTVSKLSDTIEYSKNNAVIGADGTLVDLALSENKIVLIPGRIPYDIFERGDSVSCSGVSVITSTINKKGLIIKNNAYYSMLVLNNSMSGYNIISPDILSDNLLLVYKNEKTVQDKQTKNYNIWGTNSLNGNIYDNNVDIIPTTHSVGSYGDMSLFLDKNILSNNFHTNELTNIDKIYNNKLNDKIKYNKIKIFTTGSSGITSPLIELTGLTLSESYGFSYSKNDLDITDPVFIKEKEKVSYYYTPDQDNNIATYESITKSIKLSSCYKDIPNNFFILRTDHKIKDSTTQLSLPLNVVSGELEIENCYYEYKPTKNITPAEFNWVISRLSTIENTGIDINLESLVGVGSNTNELLESSNLSYIRKHYDKLEDDPINCDRANQSLVLACNKSRTHKTIQDLSEEKNSIIQLLEDQAIYETTGLNSLNTSFSYTNYKLKTTLPITDPRRVSPNIFPKVGPVLSGIQWNGASTGELSGPVYIYNKEMNKDHYWINIDPKQSCFQDFDSNPKVLISTVYKSTEANPILGARDAYIDNNISPFFTTKPDQRINFIFGNSENVTSEVGEYKYTINSTSIEAEKLSLTRQYPAITGWTNFTKIRYFNINGDETMDSLLGPGAEVTIESTELYAIPLIDENQGNDNSGDIVDLGGTSGCQTSVGSPAGKGLLNLLDTRVGKPSRVCNIVNLDNVNDISVMVKRIPRILRGVDMLSTVYRYGSKSEFRPASAANPKIPFEVDLINSNGGVGNINNSLYNWVAFQRNPLTLGLEPAELPDFLKLQNEMIFRSFFGSVDKIENKSDTSVSQFPWELIPYEY